VTSAVFAPAAMPATTIRDPAVVLVVRVPVKLAGIAGVQLRRGRTRGCPDRNRGGDDDCPGKDGMPEPGLSCAIGHEYLQSKDATAGVQRLVYKWQHFREVPRVHSMFRRTPIPAVSIQDGPRGAAAELRHEINLIRLLSSVGPRGDPPAYQRSTKPIERKRDPTQCR